MARGPWPVNARWMLLSRAASFDQSASVGVSVEVWTVPVVCSRVVSIAEVDGQLAASIQGANSSEVRDLARTVCV